MTKSDDRSVADHSSCSKENVMRTATILVSLGVFLSFSADAARSEEIKISGVHNCCGACCKAIHEALGKVEGVSDVTAEPKKPDFVFQATDKKVARKAIGALARAGFHGKVGDEKLTFPKSSGVKAGKVTRLSLVGIHNCCPGCCKAAKEAIAKVAGVEADTLKPKSRKFVIEGDFDGAAVVKALNDAGFFVRNADAPKKKEKKKKKSEN
jgi:copper chaperone CopZ